MRAPALFLSLLLIPATAGAQDYLNCRFAPGWEQSGAIRQYVSGNLYDYKDGGAEGYLAYGFVRMTGIDCKSGANTLQIDVSEMADPDAAYGIFSANLDPAQPVARIGMGGQVQPQSANDTAMLQALAAKIESRLDGRVTPPEPLQWFPQQDLASVRMVPESVLGLRQLQRGFVAKYRQGQAFIVVEASPESAAAVLKALREHFAGASPAQIGDEAFEVKVPYLEGLCIFRKGRILAGYSNLPDASQAAIAAAKLAAYIP